MKKILLFTLALMFLIPNAVLADRNVSTIKGFTSDTLVKRGDWKIYRITFVATANGGNFTVYDSLTAGAGSNTNVKTESSEATSLNGKPMDFTGKPLEGSTGLYLTINTANVVIEYE